MFSLSKLSYIICNENEKWFYDKELETLKIDVKPCCTELLQYIKSKRDYLNTDKDFFFDDGT